MPAETLTDSQIASIISWGYIVKSESGGCDPDPDPDDTVRIYAEAEGIELTDAQIEQGIKALCKEFGL